MTGGSASAAPTLTEIRRILGEHLPELRARYGVRSLAFFGSYVRGEQDARSDLDILVEYETPPDFFQFIELEDDLGHLLGVRVDLVMKSALRPHIGRRILAESVPV
ncbi:MAG: nucleotidyltransferase family protein [Thermoflexales bacterium]|nr:nucleotidyltransferase family protein [Thermoflexales bacterium]